MGGDTVILPYNICNVYRNSEEKGIDIVLYVRMYNYSTTRDPDGSANPRAFVNYSAATGGPYAVLRKYSKDSNGKWTYKDTNMAPNNTYAVKSGNTWIPVTVKNGTWTDSSGKTRTETKEFTFNSATGITIPNLYYGSVLKFKELVDDSYQQVITYTTGDGTTGTLTPDADGYYSVTANSDVNIDVQNINKRVVIPVGKNYVGLPGTGTAGTFRFKVEVQTEKGWVTLNTSAYPRLYADPTVTVAPGGSTSVDADIRFAPGDTTKKTLRFTEIKADGVLCDEAAFLVDVSFDANGEPKLLTHGTNNSFMVSTVRFENTQLLPLELKKVISGNAADPNRVFSFRVNVTLANGKAGNYIVTDLLGNATEDNGTFYLTNNSVAKVMIPYGATVSVEEQNSDPYTTVITVNGKQEGNHNGSPTRKTNLKVTGTSNSIVYENRYQILIDTGVVLESLPYILILAAVAVGAILFLRKRKDQDD